MAKSKLPRPISKSETIWEQEYRLKQEAKELLKKIKEAETK